MAIEPIFEKVFLSGKRRAVSEPTKCESKTMVATDAVSQILSATATAEILSCECQDGQIKCDGRTIFYICFISREGEIKKTECNGNFSAIIKDGDIKAGCRAQATAEVVKTECDLNGASLGVWANIITTAEACENQELNALSGGERLVIDTQDITLFKSYGLREGTYPLEEEFELNCEVKEVLSHRAGANINAVSAGVGSIIVDGQVYLTVIALQNGEKSSIIKEVRALPFRNEIECEEAMPTMQATASVNIKGLKTQVLVDQETGKSKVTVSLNLCFTGEVFSSEEKTVAKDAFSVTENLELIKEQAQSFKPCGSQCASVGFNGRAVVAELPIGVTLFAVGNERAEVLSSELKGSKLKCTGVISAIGYFCDGENKPFTRRLETAFEKELDCTLNGELDCVRARAERVTARLISATEIELDGELILCAETREKCVVDCIREVKSVGEKTPNTHAISVYIPLEDEELWSLAKRLNVCPESLVETNPELTFPLTGKERIVVYRKL